MFRAAPAVWRDPPRRTWNTEEKVCEINPLDPRMSAPSKPSDTVARGTLYIVAAPSGAGKSSIVNATGA